MIVKCSHCRKILSLESFDSHKCKLTLKECKTIEVIYFQDESFEDRKIMAGRGIDGILYTFEVVPRKPIPIVMATDDFSQDEKQPKNSQNQPLF
jgi:phage FluMu protein Com